VSVTGSQSGSIEWTPTTDLYTDATATTPYGGESLTTVYAKPGNTTTYTATAASLAGCTISGSVEITVNSIPVVSITPDNTDICNGTSTTLTASVSSGTATYNWSPAGGTASGANNENYSVSPSSTTTYTATATSVEGCTATATATVNVNALPAPSIAASSNPTTCGGNEGSISLGGLTAGVTYEVNYD